MLLAVLFFGHAAFQLGGAGIPEEVQLVAWVVFVVGVGIYALRARGSLGTVTAALNVFAMILVAMSLATIVPAETMRAVRASEGEPVSDEVVIATTRAPERDIYFLNFDRYGSDWSLKEAYGIENDLYPDLEAMGFQVIPGARANYHTSDLSLASTLNMRYLDELTETVGRDSGYPPRRASCWPATRWARSCASRATASITSGPGGSRRERAPSRTRS